MGSDGAEVWVGGLHLLEEVVLVGLVMIPAPCPCINYELMMLFGSVMGMWKRRKGLLALLI